tara:strand:+ start:70 stop:711 length:642 start_codon:yes stop_codon:yes gene_type:complete
MSEIRVENIVGETGTDAVNFSKGINVSSGIITATSFSGSGANLTSLPAANLTGTLPAISGANLTGVGAGKLLKIHYATTETSVTINTPSRADTGLSVTFTPEALGSSFFVQANQFGLNGVSGDQALFNLYLMRSIDGGTATEIQDYFYLGNYNSNHRAYHGSPLGHKDTPSYSAGQTINYHIEAGFYTANYSLQYKAQEGQLSSTIFVYEMGA